ncbi:MAG: TetR/AcrR family transcriptional regulator [Deltaproteobacteria bacterium]|nr:MAG: TetR/AcrR family transcriptional regulator [Deltaproteobacteria bacterium]
MAKSRRRISREEILEGAATILESGVFADLTVDSLARELHMSKSTLYKHFASKDDLIVALVDRRCQDTERELEEANFLTDSLDALKLIFKIYASHAARLPAAVILQSHKLPRGSQERVERTSSTLGRSFRSVLKRGVEEGTFTDVGSELAATCFIACAEGAMVAAARGSVQLPRSEAVESVHKLLLPGLGVSV